MIRKLAVAAALWALVPSVFAMHVKTYAGPRLSREKVALLGRSEQAVGINAIDGKRIPGDKIWRACTFELLPGPHALRLIYESMSASGTSTVSKSDIVVQFDAKAGHSYSVVAYLSRFITPQINNQTSVGYWSARVIDRAEPTDIKEEMRIDSDPEKEYVAYRKKPSKEIVASEAVALVNLDRVSVLSIDGVEIRGWNVINSCFKLSLESHVLSVQTPLKRDEPPARVQAEVVAGRVYALIAGDGLVWDPWRPAIIDITDEMDNVKESLVGTVNRCLGK